MEFLIIAALAVLQKTYSKSVYVSEMKEYVAVAYTASMAVSFLVLAICALVKRDKSVLRLPSKKTMLLTALVGVILGSAQYLTTFAASVVDGVVLYPAYNGSTTLLMTLSGIALFHERMNKRQIIGSIAGIAAIVLISI